MKKICIILFIILFCPNIIFAYSKFVIPGGESIGINIEFDGILVVGYYKVDDKYINKDIYINDRIVSVNNKKISSISEFSNIINKLTQDEVSISLVRNNTEVNKKLKIVKENKIINTGLYVKDNVSGIGTLTFVDPVSKKYASLGHPIILNETNSKVILKSGSIYESIIKDITRSKNGSVGSKKADILYDAKLGSILANTDTGLYGYYTNDIKNRNTIEVGDFDSIKRGKAYIMTVIENQEVKKYEINIVEKYYNRKDTAKAFGFEIVDKSLISKSGGIVQGMSGSPIIQDNKIIGAVTNVIIDDVTLGYGISIITMLEELDKIK